MVPLASGLSWSSSCLVTCGSQLATGKAGEQLLYAHSVHGLTLPLSLGMHESRCPAALASMDLRALLAQDQAALPANAALDHAGFCAHAV